MAAPLSLYQEKGVSTTTMLDVARRADVAPGTVANHFGSAAALATEATAAILADLRMATPDLFDGGEHISDRMPLLVRELAAFFDRSGPWYRVSQRDPADAEFWADAGATRHSGLGAPLRPPSAPSP